ncbi:MAG TPA: SH3-like domain-containing protein [Solirubrobacteraceae bacterium]|nr:SH3-like domain-containing protein [Solirubrobacteraceae bacterium]
MRYRVGDPVIVAARAHRGHHRTPSYIRGKTGRIERVHAAFRNPETRAYGDDGLPKMPLYLVSFARSDLWPNGRADEGHRVYVDVFEHWLEEAK